MINVSEIKETRPQNCESELRSKVYDCLEALKISYQRVDTDEAITMEDCAEINKKLNMEMVKTLFLCNRQQTRFYLFITKDDKPFRSKEFSAALGISRVSFAPKEKMEEMMGTRIGAATVFGVLNDSDNEIAVVIDKEVAQSKWYGCSDGVTTGYMKIETQKIINDFLSYAKHIPKIIEV